MKDSEKQQRDTKQRRLVYDSVMSRCDHPNADDIYTQAHAADPRLSKGTVYRNLKVLSENGDVLHVKIPGTDRYDRNVYPHYHVLCTVCGKVVDAPLVYSPELDAAVSENTGFAIDTHRTVFEGICPECQKK